MGTKSCAVIYLRNTFEFSDAIASFALPVMIFAIAAARLSGDYLIFQFGLSRIVRILLSTTRAGLLILTTENHEIVELLGLILIGLGISVSYPVAYSTVARWGGDVASDRVAAWSLAQQVMLNSVSALFLGPLPVFLVCASLLLFF
jgi:fucose permease